MSGLPRFLARGQPQPEVIRVISRKTNRRHMTGDHHGRTAARATLLVTAADEIFGTHRFHRLPAKPVPRTRHGAACGYRGVNRRGGRR